MGGSLKEVSGLLQEEGPPPSEGRCSGPGRFRTVTILDPRPTFSLSEKMRAPSERDGGPGQTAVVHDPPMQKVTHLVWYGVTDALWSWWETKDLLLK